MRSAIPPGSISNSYYRAARRSVEAILRTSQPTGRERRRAFPRRASIAASTGRVAHAPATRGPRAGRRTGDGRELRATRSEEHTSERQSLRHLVCRLLLEKIIQDNLHKWLYIFLLRLGHCVYYHPS